MKKYSTKSIIAQVIVIAILALLNHMIGLNKFLFAKDIFANITWACIFYSVIWYVCRNIFLRNSNMAIDLVKKEKYAEAIILFKKEYEILKRKSWIDKYAFILLNASKHSLKELALNNIAYCYEQIGDKENAKKYYERLKEEFPSTTLTREN